MPYIKEICIAGNTVEVIKKYSSRSGIKHIHRSENNMPTPLDVQRNNDIVAQRRLRRLINHNFKPGDMHVVLTYMGEEPSQLEAKCNLKKFIRKLTVCFRKQGRILKYISVTEFLEKRIHHHIVISRCDGIDLTSLWAHGNIDVTFLDGTGNYTLLANYFIKETTKTFRGEGCVFKRRYNCSRTIEQPVVITEIISSKKWLQDPKEIKGYYIVKDSIVNIITSKGYPYQEYTQVRLDADLPVIPEFESFDYFFNERHPKDYEKCA